ncbi:hypothetical protein [Novipirellula rosea]|uniref:PEGA domain-containing protein n=1 Tax=Novipirellula rosea TaxID=1031540 RepID=A0ABP8N4A2_9BACT
MTGMVGAQKPMARVGNLFLPADEIRPIRITIDGDFVGHAMVGPQDITPVFVLPKGLHKFTFAIEGSDPAPAEITVLGTGSKQYLIAKLPSEKTLPKDSATSVDATAVQPSGN